ncbi:hypothetical protein Taro_002237 [Colocasia esculenta]|uniref:tetraacyldisaccharide 4'-kinase n=1 Tax=Colocasia esculenta TaxID=4460 RepID=A0A843TKC8_COLES|nr:hypothetical protein [Colocasia esculenta]
MGALHVDQLDFIDHHFIQRDDIVLIRKRLRDLECGFQTKAIAIVTEKDYDRDPAILRELHDFKVLVMCSSLEIMSFPGRTVENFEEQLMKVLLRNTGPRD